MPVWTKREVLTFLDRVEPVLDRMDHFQLLDVAIDAGDPAIQDAFHGMAAALHPDRHRRELTPEQLERLTIVYAGIAEAYRVLRDPMLREVYLRDMARKAVTAPTQPAASRKASTTAAPPADPDIGQLARINPKAQSLYRRAQAALRTGDRTSALLNLKMALAAHPTSTFLQEALARVLDKK